MSGFQWRARENQHSTCVLPTLACQGGLWQKLWPLNSLILCSKESLRLPTLFLWCTFCLVTCRPLLHLSIMFTCFLLVFCLWVLWTALSLLFVFSPSHSLGILFIVPAFKWIIIDSLASLRLHTASQVLHHSPTPWLNLLLSLYLILDVSLTLSLCSKCLVHFSSTVCLYSVSYHKSQSYCTFLPDSSNLVNISFRFFTATVVTEIVSIVTFHDLLNIQLNQPCHCSFDFCYILYVSIALCQFNLLIIWVCILKIFLYLKDILRFLRNDSKHHIYCTVALK